VSSVGASNATIVVDGTAGSPTLRVGDLSAIYTTPAAVAAGYGKQGPTGWAIDPVAGYGAKANAKTVTDAAMTAASAVLTSASASFVPADVGKTVVVHGAGAGVLAETVVTLGSATSGGFFAAGAYFWKVTALNKNGETVGSNEVTATLTIGQQQVLNWGAVTGATAYTVFRGTSAGAENTAVAYLGAVTTFTDRGLNSGFNFSPPTVNTTGATLTATISGYTSPTQVNLTASATTTVSAVEMSFGADDTTAIQNALNAAVTASGLIIDRRYGNRWGRGGSRLLIPPGNYITTSPISIPPRITVEAPGATFIAAHTGSVVTFSTGGAFNGDGVQIRSLAIDGSNLAAVGLDLELQNHSHFADMLIYHVDTGIKTRGAQWNKFTNVAAQDCGTVGVDIDKDSGSGVQTADIVFDRCYFQGNPTGASVNVATNVMFNGCSAQMAGYGGAGYLIMPGSVGTLISGGHLEYNGFHVDIQAGAKGTVIVAPMTVLTCYRHVRNSGTNTQVYGLASYSNTPVVPFNGSLAPIEQNTTNGDITFYGQNTLTTGKLFCDETGTEYDPDTASVPTRMTWVHKDLRQSAETFWKAATYKSVANAAALNLQLTGDSFTRLSATTNGSLIFGGGTATGDSALLWIAANLMMLTSSLIPDATTRNIGTASNPWGHLYLAGLMHLPKYTTAGRPAAATATAGATYYDTTLSKPGYSDGTNWRDAAGTII
jgi:hypothetical protein